MRKLIPALIFVAACGSGEGEVHNLPDGGASTTVPDALLGPETGGRADAGGHPPGDATALDVVELLPELRDDGQPVSWKNKVQAAVDTTSMAEYFANVGYTLPAGSAAYAVRIGEGAGYPGYQFFDVGGGAFDMSFWPASTIKLLAALAALEWVYGQGFTGGAQVEWDSGFGDQLRAIYERSIGVSSNIDYDRTLRAAGWDFTNADFLSEERGFPRTVITSSYASVEVRDPGGYTLSEDGQSKYVAGRPGVGDYGRNDTDLYELTEGVRRIMLDGELPEDERFRIDPADVAGVQAALCGATPSFFAAGATEAFGGAPTICHKPGWVPDNECLDHGLVIAPDGSRYLIAASVPYATNCPTLSPLARTMLEFLRQAPPRVPLQPDFGEVVVQVDPGQVQLRVPGADEVVLWVNGLEVARSAFGDRGHFVLEYDVLGSVILAVGAYSDGLPVAFRSARFGGN